MTSGTPVRAEPPTRPEPRPTWLPAAAAGAVALLVVAVAVLLRSSGGQDTFNPGAGPVPSGHAHDVVVHAGNTVRAAGTVLAAPGRPVRLCAPLGGAASGGTGITRHCDGVDLTGLDLGRLTDRAERGGVVTGAAAVVGTYRDGRIAVSRQTAPPAAQADDLPQPPCAAPPDGWPRGSAVDLGAALRYQQRHRAEVVEVAVLRPSPDHAVAYVLTAGDPNPAGKALEPTYGPRLCVFRSRYTTAQLDAARSAMHATASAASGDRLTTPFEAGGIGLARDGQACTPARVAIVTDTVARAVDGQPAGLVQLDVWLRPVS